VLDAAGVQRAHVFGVSMGGLIAQELSLRHPDRVASLVLDCTHPGGRDAVRMDPAAATMLMDRTPKSARETIEASVPFLYAATTSRDDIDGDLGARLEWLDGAGHLFWTDQPERTVDLVNGFLAA
jgi:3-oxoadipate enol-lactonase